MGMTNSIRLLIRPTSQSQETTIVSQCISTLKKVRKNCCLATFLLIVKGDRRKNWQECEIADNSIVGWGSIVTKEFNEPNVIIAGIPAKIVKRGINWDRRCINKYLNR